MHLLLSGINNSSLAKEMIRGVPKYGVRQCTPKTMNAAGFYIKLHPECELNSSYDFRDEQEY